MKVIKILQNIFRTKHIKTDKKIIPACPIKYDRNNVTKEKYKKYIHWLAENNINRTVIKPDRFITEAERNAIEKRKTELEEYRKFVHYLSKNNINRTFYC